MDATIIEAQTRETGSEAAREIRDNDRVPCILYGATVESTPLQVSTTALNKLIHGRSAPVAEVELDGETYNCILKDYDLHPITSRPTHADFQALADGREVTLTVPIHFQGVPLGQKNGGDTQVVVRELEISVLPENIPAQIEIPIEDLAIGDAVHVYDLDVDYEIKMPPAQTLVTVVAPHIETAPTPTEAEEEEEVTLDDLTEEEKEELSDEELAELEAAAEEAEEEDEEAAEGEEEAEDEYTEE
jgi:large subunit ribosomal protein L25